MKCENCGKNDVTFVYESNLNGKITRKHLCSECAEKLGYTQAIAAQSQRMMRSMREFMGGSLFGGNLLDGFFDSGRSLLGDGMERLFDPFDDFFSDMPALSAAPTAEEAAQAQTPQTAQSEKGDGTLVDGETQSRFARMRQMNALRMELHKAIRQENFEHAAQLRDQIHALEKERGESEKHE